jgi:hypothetical protein
MLRWNLLLPSSRCFLHAKLRGVTFQIHGRENLKIKQDDLGVILMAYTWEVLGSCLGRDVSSVLPLFPPGIRFRDCRLANW